MTYPHKLINEGEARISKARSKLNREQIIFGEWLACPKLERSPRTHKELANQFSVTQETLSHWKKIPEIWMVRDETIGTAGKELVTEAIAVLRKMLDSPDLKIAGEAAKDILNRWSQPTRHLNVIASIADMWERHNED